MVRNVVLILFFVLTTSLSAQNNGFYDNNIIVELNIPEGELKKIDKDIVVNLKVTSDLTESQFKEWVENGRNHYNVKSFEVLEGDLKNGISIQISFLNGLDYATGKELFSGALLIDFIVLNGEKMQTNRFVSQKLTLK